MHDMDVHTVVLHEGIADRTAREHGSQHMRRRRDAHRCSDARTNRGLAVRTWIHVEHAPAAD